MVKLKEVFVCCACFLVVLVAAQFEDGVQWTTEDYYGKTGGAAVTEHPGGVVDKGTLVFARANSPHLLKGDLIVERDAELVIEPGVVIRVVPQIGITIRGKMIAMGTQTERIKLTAAQEPEKNVIPDDVRLVDGPSILAGRVQVKHKNKWRSLCTNSRNWTLADMSILCRQLGFQGGEFYTWYDRQMPTRSRLLLENPQCRGSETTIYECDWHTRQMGSGVCDYHPDLGVRCEPHHERGGRNWRGVRFENAAYEKRLVLENTLYIPSSSSRLEFVEVRYAGNGREHNASSALEVIGVPPIINEVDVVDSAYNGINVTSVEAPIRITNTRVRSNRGYGIFVNSSYGMVDLERCVVSENGADGVKYVHHEEDVRYDKSELFDFCTLATSHSQTYPIQIYADQNLFYTKRKSCNKVFKTRFGHRLTLHFQRIFTAVNDSASIEIYDGNANNHRLITSFNVRNNTRPESITTTTNQMFIKFEAAAFTNMFMYMRVTSGLDRGYNLNITKSEISENHLSGVLVSNLRSQLHIHDSSVLRNGHTAGVHVSGGVGNINITSSKISFNQGDGVNISYTGGNRNISRSSISANLGYGIAVWLNQSTETEYLYVNQTSVVQYSEIVKNFDIGILHGNFCGDALVNISGNLFQENLDDALEILSCWTQPNTSTKLQIGHNNFYTNHKLAIKIKPALNLDARIEYNNFKQGHFGQIYIKNQPLEQFNLLRTSVQIRNNYFLKNSGLFVISLSLSPYSLTQSLTFTRNFVKDNVIREPYELNPRSRVSAVVTVGSDNVKIFRNIIENPNSKYELGSHLEDQSKMINCSLNWLGYTDEEKIFKRIFHRNDRYNLARIIYVPFLLHNSHPLTTRVSLYPIYVPRFSDDTSNLVGGEIEGEEFLQKGEYVVEKDINIRPGGKLTIEPGVTLRFPPAVGIMVGGKLEARGNQPDSIRFTMKQEVIHANEPDNGDLHYSVDVERSAQLVDNHTAEASYGSRKKRQNNRRLNNRAREAQTKRKDLREVGYSRVKREDNPADKHAGYGREKREDGPEMQYNPKIDDLDPNIEESAEVSNVPIRLLGVKTPSEGRLQVKINEQWGTVCNYNFDITDAALICQQLGLTLNPDDWFLEPSQIPEAGTSEKPIITNLHCTEFDTDITKCKSEKAEDFENSCTHENDVGLKCYETSWAGIRFGVLADRSDLQFVTVEKAGLLDYATRVFKPAIQIDFAKHNLENVKIRDNYHDGLGVTYSDIFTTESVNTVKNSEFSFNRGAGISFKQLGLRIYNSMIDNNYFGVQHDPVLSNPQQRELAGWFNSIEAEIYYKPFRIPVEPDAETLVLKPESGNKYLVTSLLTGSNVARAYKIRTQPGYVIGIQLLNPIEHHSSENVRISSSDNYYDTFDLKRNLTAFPCTSSTNEVLVEYSSGENALGGAVIVLTSVQSAYHNKIIPTVIIKNTKIKNNHFGIHYTYYNKHYSELGYHYLRTANESLMILSSEIAHNREDAILVESPHFDVNPGNISEIKIMINNSLVLDNARGVRHFARDMRASNNLFHYILQDDTFERNRGGGLLLNLPYVWDYNENHTHSVYMDNNTFRNNVNFGVSIDGHFARVNVTSSLFVENQCRESLLAIKGMEKKLSIRNNVIRSNSGLYMVEFSSDSQSEIMGEVPAGFTNNELSGNKAARSSQYRTYSARIYAAPKSSVIHFKGIQKVKINRNLINGNQMDYLLIAGIKTAKLGNNLDVKENYWGTVEDDRIEAAIFDFNDWNNYAFAIFRPYLVENDFDASHSLTFDTNKSIDLDRLGGILNEDLYLPYRNRPYVIRSDITIMPKVTLTIAPSVVMEFGPNVGILALGTLKAQGYKGSEIVMRPLSEVGANYETDGKIEKRDVSVRQAEFINVVTAEGHNLNKPTNDINKRTARDANTLTELDTAPSIYDDVASTGALSERVARDMSTQDARLFEFSAHAKRQLEEFNQEQTIRLCKGPACSEAQNEGFLEYFNRTTLQWIPICDSRFTERNAQVVCRELGYDSFDIFFSHDRRLEFHSNSLSRIWSWPASLQCKGNEPRYEDCPLRLNEYYGFQHFCRWDSRYVFVHCGSDVRVRDDGNYWGGIRFANPDFESQIYEQRYHHHHNAQKPDEESILSYVNVIRAGILHNEKSPALQTITKSPNINHINITASASDAVNIISPSKTLNLYSNTFEDSLGIGVNILSLTGEGRDSEESSYTPLKSNINIPYNLFSLIDICDTSKIINIEERVLVYHKYDNHPVNCVKIFKSAYSVKPLGFRLLQFNLFNASRHDVPDFLSLYDGDVFNVTSKLIRTITMASDDEKRMFKTKGSSLSVKLFANGASDEHGFVAEVVTLPISAIGFNRDVQHNITYSVIKNNKKGGLVYTSVGEINPIVTVDRNQFVGNCQKLYGNFTTCKAAVNIDVQNTQTLFFRNNLISGNQGGLSIKSDSRGSATSLKSYVHNNLFVNNANLPALYVEGRQSSPYQEVTIYRNYFTRNVAMYENNIVLKQVVSNFTLNYVKRNIGLQNLEVSGFDKVRLPIYQTTSHNGFYNNYAIHRESRSTIVAGTAGQHYVDNIFFNPDNDYEMITVNRSLFNFNSTLELWKTKIDAMYNYWGVNTTIAVSGRIRDQYDDPRLLEVNYNSFYKNNETILNGKCPPGWDLVGDTCYIYIGAPMTFHEARAFCQADNASMPYIIGNLNYLTLYEFLRNQQQWYLYSDKVWVQHIDRINTCTSFVYQTVESDNCQQRYPFICEIDPKVLIDPLVWRGDIITIAAIACGILAVLLIALVIVCWWSKSKYRHAQRLERRNSIRQSLHSLRSVGSTHNFSDFGYRRKPGQLSTRSTDTLTKNSDYKKMISTNGSIDSMEKTTYNSSIEDNQSYDLYETNPNPNTSFSYNTTIEHHKPQFDSAHYAQPSFNLAYRNEGFKDNSTFATNSRAESVQETIASDDTPIIHPQNDHTSSYPPSDYCNTNTLPLHGNTYSNSTLDDNYYPNSGKMDFLSELKSKMPPSTSSPVDAYNEAKYLQHSPVEERPKSADVLETNFDQPSYEQPRTNFEQPKNRSKSETLLETNFDYFDDHEVNINQPLGEGGRSKSQPLETAM